MKAIHILSGKHRMGTIGQKTDMVDGFNKPLYVGDIVISVHTDYGYKNPQSLTVIVSDEWTSYSDGTHESKKRNVSYFAMGIKDSDIISYDSEEDGWTLVKVKSYKDVVSGEKWKDFEFNFI